MVAKRKMKCDCGGTLGEQLAEIEQVLTHAMVCLCCGWTTLTREQAHEFRKRLDFHHVIDRERKIIRIGNSLGLTLPEALRNLGIAPGTRVKLEAIDAKSFKVCLG